MAWHLCRHRFLTSCWVNFTSTSIPKFLMKSRIIWSNYDHDQKSRLHLVACNRNQRFVLHFTSFYVTFYVISCCISHHFMLHFTHFIVRIACIARISRMSRISHCTHNTHVMYYTAYHVILCIISYHFIMKIHCILIHAISHWREKK